MTFQELQQELINATKAKDTVRKSVLKDIIACSTNMAIQKGCKDNITEDIVEAAILKSKKICQEQIDTCPNYRPDILEAYQACMTCIEEYAPKMMSEDEVRKAVDNILSSTEVINKGAAMKLVMPVLKGKAEGKTINKVVTEYFK